MNNERLTNILVEKIIQDVYEHTGYNIPDSITQIWKHNFYIHLEKNYEEGFHVGRDHYEKE